MDHLRSPVELYSVDKSGKSTTQITQSNAQRLAQVQMGEPEQFTFAGWNGETVYGYGVKPAGFQQG